MLPKIRSYDEGIKRDRLYTLPLLQWTRIGWFLESCRILKAAAILSRGIATDSSLWAGMGMWKCWIPFPFMNSTFLSGYGPTTRVLDWSQLRCWLIVRRRNLTKCSWAQGNLGARSSRLEESCCGRFLELRDRSLSRCQALASVDLFLLCCQPLARCSC